MKKKVIILSLTIVLIISLTINTYSRYASSGNVHINDITGNVKCSLEITNTGNDFSSNGYAQFRIKVKNTDEKGNLSKTPLSYYLVISNTNNLGKFKYIDSLGNGNIDFLERITTKTYTFRSDHLEVEQINVEVKTDAFVSEQVDFNVDLYCNQIVGK